MEASLHHSRPGLLSLSCWHDQFVEHLQAIEEALTPRLQLSGETAKLNKFKQFFEGKTLEKGTDLILLWNPSGRLDVKAGRAGSDYSQVSQHDNNNWGFSATRPFAVRWLGGGGSLGCCT